MSPNKASNFMCIALGVSGAHIQTTFIAVDHLTVNRKFSVYILQLCFFLPVFLTIYTFLMHLLLFYHRFPFISRKSILCIFQLSLVEWLTITA
jgi:hypothetical protein